MLGMLEERETAARVRVEGLREEVARPAEALEAAEIELDRRVIAREELVETLAASAAEFTAGTGTEEKAVLPLAPVPGSTVRPSSCCGSSPAVPAARCSSPTAKPPSAPWPWAPAR
ncbi:hypothetical protein ACIO87_29365 [Streptomyces sp. NPDC087218]|uniref:hypothetical protein n=1 Tax=Streptomyces sp. NPDC087218 TaxID=3365769 RepID=UPI0038263CCA